jgi:hypothetical protein
MPLFNPPTSSSGLTGYRNRTINGGMQIDQRNSGTTQTFTAGAALAYSVDRFYGYCTGANVAGQQVAGSGTNQYRYQFTGAASVTAIGFGHRYESINIYDLNNSTCTFSVDLANSLLTSVTWTAYYANTTDTFGSLAVPSVTQIATGTFTVSSGIANYSASISVPSAATTGIEIRLTVGAQTSGTWTIGNWQFELGTTATAFERRPIGAELLLCQRYLPAFKSTSTNSTTNWVGFAANTTAATGNFKFPVQTRAAITGLTVSAASHFTLARPSTGNIAATAVSFAAGSRDAAQVEFTVASGLVADIGYYAYMNNASGNIYFNGAEL